MSDDAEPTERPKAWFNTDEMEWLQNQFQNLYGERLCELCGHDTWGVGTAPVSPVVLNFNRENGVVVGNFDQYYPSAILHCKKCGNSKIILLSSLGFDLPKDVEK